MKHAIKSGAVVLATAALVLIAGSTAHAAQGSVDDRTGDVWKAPAERGHWSEAGSPLNGDIDTTDVDHGTDTLTLTTTYKRLAKKKVGFEPYYLIRTDTGAEYVAFAYAGPRMWAGDHGFYEETAPTALRHLRGVPPTEEEPCADMTHKVSYRTDTVTLDIPRSCVGDASWVKVKSLALSFTRNSQRLRVDNGHLRGHAFKGWTGQIDAEVAPTV